jgi:excisionase family DNA binding protein
VEKLTLTVPEPAYALGISRGRAYDCVRTGQIESIKVGRRILIPMRSLLIYVGEKTV